MLSFIRISALFFFFFFFFFFFTIGEIKNVFAVFFHMIFDMLSFIGKNKKKCFNVLFFPLTI